MLANLWFTPMPPTISPSLDLVFLHSGTLIKYSLMAMSHDLTWRKSFSRGEKQREWCYQLDICDSHIDVILGGNRDSDPESQKSRQDDHLSGCALWSLLHARASY
ncbi:hypothetical protein TNIN_234471 [Trichonephila inaurata madagascariensis]|uniref:Uncharacterized protein n=1 Tax=Trichonephila inaurata madagascariensis TaxID=2747483 RepID=A0A8X6IGX7_9ARAC|nr:hypothetical protein TNIN_234471 [Trichonephila inaurata madagascariensis]